MSNSDVDVLEHLKSARVAILDGLLGGQAVIEYQIRGRMKRTTNPDETLKILCDLILKWETKIGRHGRSPNRVVKLFGTSN